MAAHRGLGGPGRGLSDGRRRTREDQRGPRRPPEAVAGQGRLRPWPGKKKVVSRRRERLIQDSRRFAGTPWRCRRLRCSSGSALVALRGGARWWRASSSRSRRWARCAWTVARSGRPSPCSRRRHGARVDSAQVYAARRDRRQCPICCLSASTMVRVSICDTAVIKGSTSDCQSEILIASRKPRR